MTGRAAALRPGVRRRVGLVLLGNAEADSLRTELREGWGHGERWRWDPAV